MACDWKDTNLVKGFLEERNPFEHGPVLCNVADGVHAHATVNVDDAEVIGDNILSKMVEVNADEFSFKWKDQAVTLASKSAIKVDGEAVQIDPQLLFQRLTVAGNNNLEDSMKYELCTFPPALFESQDLLNQPQKANFAEAIWSNITKEEVVIPKLVQYVVDGGALLHHIPWTHGSTFGNILDSYSDYVVKKYGKATIVFDGYCGASTKDMTHRRRAKGRKGPTVSFTKEMCLTVAKDVFLSDPQNKQNFLQLLGDNPQMTGCDVFHATSDADVLIVQKAIESADNQDTTLVGDDTDLLVLLLYHTKLTSYNLFFAPEPRKNAKKRVWDIKKAFHLHALLGCDSTSRLFVIGKGAVLKKF